MKNIDKFWLCIMIKGCCQDDFRPVKIRFKKNCTFL